MKNFTLVLALLTMMLFGAGMVAGQDIQTCDSDELEHMLEVVNTYALEANENYMLNSDLDRVQKMFVLRVEWVMAKRDMVVCEGYEAGVFLVDDIMVLVPLLIDVEMRQGGDEIYAYVSEPLLDVLEEFDIFMTDSWDNMG